MNSDLGRLGAWGELGDGAWLVEETQGIGEQEEARRTQIPG